MAKVAKRLKIDCINVIKAINKPAIKFKPKCLSLQKFSHLKRL